MVEIPSMRPPIRVTGFCLVLLLSVVAQGAGVAAARVIDTSASLQANIAETTFFLDGGVLFGYSLATGELWHASDPDERLQAPRISPDGTMFVAGPRPLRVGTLDGEVFRRLSSVVFDATDYEWSRDSRFIYVRTSHSIDVIDVGSGALVQQLEVPFQSRLLGSTSDGFLYHEIAADGTVGDVVFYDSAAGAVVRRVDGSGLRALSVQPDGSEMYVRQGLQIMRLRLGDGVREHIADLPADVDTVVSPDGRYVVMRSELLRSATRIASTHHLHLLDTETDETIPILQGDFIRISGMQWLPDSSGFILDHRDGAGSPNYRNHVSVSGAMRAFDILGQVVGSAVVAEADKGPAIEVQWPAVDPEPAGEPAEAPEPIDDGLDRTATVPLSPAELVAPATDTVERLHDGMPRSLIEVDDQVVELSLSTGEHAILTSGPVGPWSASVDGRDVAYHTGRGGRPGYVHVLTGATSHRLNFGGPTYATSALAWGADRTLYFDHAVGSDDRRIAKVTFDEGEASEIAFLTEEGRSSFLLAAAGHRIVYFERVPSTGEDGVVVYDVAAQAVIARLPAVAIVEGTPASLSQDGSVGSVRIGPSLFALDLSVGEATVIEDGWRTSGSSRVAPDGSTIAYVEPLTADSFRLVLHDVASSVSTQLGEATGPISTFEWLPDSSGLLVTASLGSQGIVYVDLEGNRTALGVEGRVGRVVAGSNGVDGFSCDAADPLDDCASLLLGAPVGEAMDAVSDGAEAEVGVATDTDSVEQPGSEYVDEMVDEEIAALIATLERERAAQDFVLRIPASSTSYGSDGDSILDTRSGRRLVFGVPLMLIGWAVRAARREAG